MSAVGWEEQILRAGEELLRRLRDDPAGDLAERLVELERLLREIGEPRCQALQALVSSLLEGKVVLLGKLGRAPEQRQVLDELVARFGSWSEGAPAVSAGWALLQMIRLNLAARTFEEAIPQADLLTGMFARQLDTQDLTRFGSILLQASDWLMDARVDEPALRMCRTVSERLTGADDPRRQVVGAGARAGCARALAHLGRHDEAREEMDAFVATGEIGLRATEQARARLAPGDQNGPIRVGLGQVTILVVLGREDEARRVAAQTRQRAPADSTSFTQQLLKELDAVLAEQQST